MPRSKFQNSSILRKISGVVFGLGLVTAIALLLARFSGQQHDLQTDLEEDMDFSAGDFELAESVFPSSVIEKGLPPQWNKESDEAELTPDEVIDQTGGGCGMLMGQGSATDLAIVVTRVPRGKSMGGTKFSVLDQSGAVNSGVLPFLSFQTKLGKTSRGQAIAGFGGIRLGNPNSTGLYAEGEPLRIYIDRELVYEREHVWLFDVAANGSSFFYIESLGSDYSSRLAISSLDQGTETHYYLGTTFSHPKHDLTYLASFTSGTEEVHLEPISARHSKGLGTHYFFDVQGEGPSRRMSVPDRGLKDQALFTSSEEGYLLYEAANGADNLHIVKARLDWSSGVSTAVWRQEGPMGTRASHVEISPDGAWLLYSTNTAGTVRRRARNDDRVLYVLDAATGERAFVLPIVDSGKQMLQLSSVLPPQATENDVGWYNGAFFVGNDRLVVRRLRDTDGLVDETVKFYDIYDMNSISLDAQPEYRVESNQHWQNVCASEGFPGTLITGEDGRLAYARRLE